MLLLRQPTMVLPFSVAAFCLLTYAADAFVPATPFCLSSQQNGRQIHRCPARGVVSRLTTPEETTSVNNHKNDEGVDVDVDEDIAFLFEEHPPSYEELDSSEKVWRHAKKPLLRIGSKGATHAHGNSLRQLLEDHTVVKVKVNTKKFNNSLQEAYEALRGLAIENGAPADMELIQLRESSKEIVFGMPGTLQRMEEGTFPPPPPKQEDEDEDSSSMTA